MYVRNFLKNYLIKEHSNLDVVTVINQKQWRTWIHSFAPHNLLSINYVSGMVLAVGLISASQGFTGYNRQNGIA